MLHAGMHEHFGQIPAVDPRATHRALDEVDPILIGGTVMVVVHHG